MSFFETTPLGRIMNRFSKDIDTIDNTVSDALRMFLLQSANITGSFVLIATVIPWFLVAVGAVMMVYYALGLYYRASARELKRLDAILRSSLYAHFSESLTGLATIRAYGETERFRRESEGRVNVENRFFHLCQIMCDILTFMLQGLLANDRESTLDRFTDRYTRSTPHFCRRYPCCHCPVLHLPFSNRPSAQLHHHHPTSLLDVGSSIRRIGE